MQFSKFITQQFPFFARPDYPVMRHTLASAAPNPRARRLQIFAYVLIGALAVAIGAFIATESGTAPLRGDWYGQLFPILYWPLTFMLLVCRIFALTSTLSTVEEETKRGTWDTLKITASGANLLLRTRWAAVFWRVWIALVIITVLRLFFSLVTVVRVGTYQGGLLDLMLSGTTPFGSLFALNGIQGEPTPLVSVIFSVVLMAITLTAGLILPLTGIAFDAALGTFLGTFGRGKVFGVVGRVVVILLRLTLTVGVLFMMGGAIYFGSAPTPDPAIPFFTEEFNAVFRPNRAVVVTTLGVLEGDFGLTLLDVDRVQRLWADLPYGALIGPAALIYAFMQILGANVLVGAAARRASTAER